MKHMVFLVHVLVPGSEWRRVTLSGVVVCACLNFVLTLGGSGGDGIGQFFLWSRIVYRDLSYKSQLRDQLP